METILLKILLMCSDPAVTAPWADAPDWLAIDYMVAPFHQPIAVRTLADVDVILLALSRETPAPELRQHAEAVLALCESLREKTVIPLLLLAPMADEAYMLEAYAAGVDEYLVQPMSPALLLAKLQAWLRWTAR